MSSSGSRRSIPRPAGRGSPPAIERAGAALGVVCVGDRGGGGRNVAFATLALVRGDRSYASLPLLGVYGAVPTRRTHRRVVGGAGAGRATPHPHLADRDVRRVRSALPGPCAGDEHGAVHPAPVEPSGAPAGAASSLVRRRRALRWLEPAGLPRQDGPRRRRAIPRHARDTARSGDAAIRLRVSGRRDQRPPQRTGRHARQAARAGLLRRRHGRARCAAPSLLARHGPETARLAALGPRGSELRRRGARLSVPRRARVTVSPAMACVATWAVLGFLDRRWVDG